MIRPLRTFNRVLSAAIAFGMLWVSFVTIVEVILAGFKRKPLIFHWPKYFEHLQRLSWDASSVQWTLILIGVAALVLLYLEVTKRRPVALNLQPNGTIAVSVMRPDLEKSLRYVAENVDDVFHARVKVKRPKKIRIRAMAVTNDKKMVRGHVKQVAADYLQSLGLVKAPKIKVRIRKAKAV